MKGFDSDEKEKIIAGVEMIGILRGSDYLILSKDGQVGPLLFCTSTFEKMNFRDFRERIGRIT